MRLTLGDLKTSRLPQLLGLQACHADFVSIVNEAQQRLVMGAEMWWESYQKYRISTTSGMVTWPRQVANVITLSVDCEPYTIRNEWYEFLESGFGVRTSTSLCSSNVVDRGTSCLFSDINTAGNDKRLRVYSTIPESASKTIGILGYDDEGEWIRTFVGSDWVDGEWLSIPINPNNPTLSTKNWSAITDILKPLTNGDVWVYEYDTVAGTERRIGIYEPDETRPRYRRTLIGSIGNGVNATTAHTVTAMVKREFIPVRNDNDFLIIGSLPALKDMCMSIQKRERSNFQEAAVLESSAMQIMDREAAHYIGPSRVVPIRADFQNWGMGDVPDVQ